MTSKKTRNSLGRLNAALKRLPKASLFWVTIPLTVASIASVYLGIVPEGVLKIPRNIVLGWRAITGDVFESISSVIFFWNPAFYVPALFRDFLIILFSLFLPSVILEARSKTGGSVLRSVWQLYPARLALMIAGGSVFLVIVTGFIPADKMVENQGKALDDAIGSYALLSVIVIFSLIRLWRFARKRFWYLIAVVIFLFSLELARIAPFLLKGPAESFILWTEDIAARCTDDTRRVSECR